MARSLIKNLMKRVRYDDKPLMLLIFSLILVLIVGTHFVNSLNKVEHLTIAAGSSRAESYALSQAIAQKIVKCNPKIQLHVLETKGDDQNIQLLETNKVQLATAPINNSVSRSTKLVTLLYSDMFQLVVTEKSGIQNVSDLKGKRIAVPPPETSQDNFFWMFANHYRLAKKDLNVVVMEATAADEAFRFNQIDALFRVRPPGNKYIQQLVQQSGGRLIAIDQAAAMKINHPELEPATIPKGAYQGNIAIPTEDLPTVAIRRMLVANPSVDSDTIQEITRIIYEHRQELAARMPLTTQITPPNQGSGSILPLHPGALAYYNRDKPNFLEQNANSIGLIFTIALAVGSWIWQLKEKFEQAKKNRSDHYNQTLVKLIKDIQCCPDLAMLENFRKELYSEFEIIVNALDQDKITPEAFQSLKFAWEAAMYALRDREVWLTNHRSSQIR